MNCMNLMVWYWTQIRKSASKKSISFYSIASCLSQNFGAIYDADDLTHHVSLNGIPIPDVGISSLNSIITKFSKLGDLISARHVFDHMPQRDTVSWNSMMSAYDQNDQCDQVFKLFLEMQTYGLKPNYTSFSVVLSSCAKLRDLNSGKQIHGLSIKNCSSANVFVGASLITMYSKCMVFSCLIMVFDGMNQQNLASWNALISGLVLNRRIEDARRVFDRMPSRNIISWTAMINGYVEIKKIRNAFELFDLMPMKNLVTWSVMLCGLVSDEQFNKAVEIFNEMRSGEVRVGVASVISVINACSGMKNPIQGRKFHGYVIKVGFDLDRVVEASLVSMYFKCLNIWEAQLEFDKMGCKYIGSWNALICCYINNNQIDEARRFFNNMNEKDQFSWNLMINCYLSNNRIDNAVELFMEMPEPTVETRTAIMSGFVENGRLADAQQVFDEMPQRDVMAYTTLISGYMKEGLLAHACELFKKMPQRNVVTYNVMISGLIQHGKVMDAYKLFNESPEKDVISWNSMIIGYIQNGFNEDAFRMYRQMISSDVRPSKSVITTLLSSCARLSILDKGKQMHVAAIKFGYESCLVVANSLINMYGKCGDMMTAILIFDQMAEHDSVTWNAVINGYAVNGLSEQGIGMFEQMKKARIKPDDITFLGVLSACSHGGLIEEAHHYFSSMRYDHGIVPRLPHYACMVDLLCRMGSIEKAEELVYSMPFEPDSVIWTSLLSGCKLNCNLAIAEHAANQLFALNSRDPMPYLHLVRIYGSAGKWVDMQKLRLKMNKLGLNKRPGCSWIEINGEISSFFAGDTSHPLSEQVQTHLRIIVSEIKELGYVPNYSLVLEEMEDQEKEEILIQHSEKLAIAYGLMRAVPLKPLRIIKNLRVCGDCHSAFKLISLSRKCEIVMRDAVRFHHFKGGFCSCSDYW